MRRVAITGLGVICASGNDVPTFWQSISSGKSAIRELTRVDASKLKFRNGAEVEGFDAEKHFPSGKSDLLDRFAQLAMVAARQALADAGVQFTPELSVKTAIIMGSCVGGQDAQDIGFQNLYLQDRNRVSPLTIPKVMANAGASQISMEFGITGPAMAISTACSSANHAIGQAFWMVRSGQAELALAGGSEAPFSFGILKAWEAMRVVSQETCRPFSKDRSGMILGEGGAVLVLEPMEAAIARGANVYAEICGFGMSSDAHHLTQPNTAGPARAMRAAMEDGGIAPESIGYINAHGTATATNDAIESRAIKEVFGAHTPLVSSTKSMHGHALGAAGALEAAATVLALEHGLLPPTANFTEADPECEVNLLIRPHAAEVEFALSNSFAFGGLNAVLAFRQS